MSSINQELQLRKHSDVTAIFQNQLKEQEIDQYFDDIPKPALKKYKSNFSEQDYVINDKIQNINDYDYEQEQEKVYEYEQEQELEYRISINSNQDDEKLQTTYFQQFNFININNHNNSIKEKRNRKLTHYNEFFDYDLDQHQQNNSPCKCNKSHCLLLYCSCFHKNIVCSNKCKCYDCHNNQDYSQIRKQALDKVKIKQQRLKNDDDLFDKTTVWGCQCKKSQCKKNYCECFIRNKKCSSLCKCNDCQNKKRITNLKKIMKSKQQQY